jgi:hypothetical protein
MDGWMEYRSVYKTEGSEGSPTVDGRECNRKGDEKNHWKN